MSKKSKKKESNKFKYSVKALLSSEIKDYGVSDAVKEKLQIVARHISSNPTIKENKKFYIKHILTSESKITRKGSKVKLIPYTDYELCANSQAWLTYTIGSLIRRGIIKSASSFQIIS